MGTGGRDKDPENTARDAALSDPDSVFHDFAAETTARRAVEALTATDPETAEPALEKSGNLYARSEKRGTGALTKEMIKRIADRAEEAAGNKK